LRSWRSALPHFLAIAWIYRDGIRSAGFKMLPGVDPTGHRTGRQAVCHTLGLLSGEPLSLSFSVAVQFTFSALLLGLAFLWFAVQFSRHLTVPRARQLFLCSILYLPLLLGLMCSTRSNDPDSPMTPAVEFSSLTPFDFWQDKTN